MIIRERLQQQDKLNLLKTTSLRLLPIIAEQADMDGLLNISVNEIKELGYMTPKLVPAAIESLVKAGWIYTNEDGKMFASYTCNTTPDNKGFYYINLFKVFKKGVFKSMYKRRINLFYYLLTSKIPGTWHSVAAERLYQNKTFSEKLALNYFEDFDDLMDNLIPLIETGFIELKLGTGKTVLSSKTSNIKERIYAFCGKENLLFRKKRFRSERDTHILHIRISEEVLKDKTTIFDADRRSTLNDLNQIATKYDFSLDVFSQQSLEEVHMTKHKIHREFGNLGIKIYRESLQAFFKHSSHSFARLMDHKEFGKVIKNHYVVPRIKLELTAAIEDAQNSSNNLSKVEAFLRYFTTEAYYDDLVLFDNYMTESHSHLYKEAKEHINVWNEFANKVTDIYTQEASLGNNKELVLKLAQKSELSSKKRTIEELQTKPDKLAKLSTNPVEIPEEIRIFRENMIARGLLGKRRNSVVHCDF